MTKEDLDFISSMNMCDEISNEAYKKIMCHCEEQQTCEDYISKEALINELKLGYFNKELQEEKNDPCVIDAMIDWAIRAVKRQPSVTPQQTRWIPVSERLPEEGEPILLSTKTGEVYEGAYFDLSDNRQWYVYRDENYAWNNVVTAWQPLPESYRGDKDGNINNKE